MSRRAGKEIRQHRIILRADTASEVRQLCPKKRREYFVYSRAFLGRRWCAAAVEAVRKASAVNYAILPKVREQGTAAGKPRSLRFAAQKNEQPGRGCSFWLREIRRG